MGNLVSHDIEGGYKRVCEELLANDPKNKSGKLHWASPPLKKEQLDHFQECLSKNTCLKRLVLQDVDTLEDGLSLAQVIQKHPTLTCLSFNGRLPKEGFEVFTEAFLQSPTLTELEIQNSIIPVTVVDSVVSVLQKQEGMEGKITSLALKGCQIDADGLHRLTKALEEAKSVATSLKKLEITLKPPIQAVESAKNLCQFFQAANSVLEEIKFAGFLQNSLPSLLKGAKGHPNLTKLTLEGTGLNDEDSIESISQLLQDAPSLSVLDLSACNLNASCGAQLAKALSAKKAAQLKEVYLAENSLSTDGVVALAQAMQDSNSPFRETLEVLDLRFNCVGSNGIVAVAKALQTNPGAFQRLLIGEQSIRNSRTFDSDDVAALSEMIQSSSTISSLNFEDASFLDEGMSNMLQALEANTTIKQLHLSCYSTASLQSVMSGLPKLHLEKIHIRVQGDAEFNQATGDMLMEALGKSESLREFSLSELKGANAAVWKSLQPKISAILSKNTSDNGKRSNEENDGPDAKKAKTE